MCIKACEGFLQGCEVGDAFEFEDALDVRHQLKESGEIAVCEAEFEA